MLLKISNKEECEDARKFTIQVPGFPLTNSDFIDTLGQCSGGMINCGPSQSSELEECVCE